MLYDYYFLDWYSLQHFWWGTLYGVLFSPITTERLEYWEGFLVALGIAVLWEIVENSQWFIKCSQAVRVPGFTKFGPDTWANLIGDICSSSAGYGIIWLGGENHWQELFILSCIIALGTGCVCTECVDKQDEEQQKRVLNRVGAQLV